MFSYLSTNQVLLDRLSCKVITKYYLEVSHF